MPDPSATIDIIREWVAKAENDLKNAVHTLTMGQDCPTDTVAFHAQQCVEKYLKAILLSEAIPFPKTHSIRALMALLPKPVHVSLDGASQDRLTAYATVMRYPDAGPEPTLAEAKERSRWRVGSARFRRASLRAKGRQKPSFVEMDGECVKKALAPEQQRRITFRKAKGNGNMTSCLPHVNLNWMDPCFNNALRSG